MIKFKEADIHIGCLLFCWDCPLVTVIGTLAHASVVVGTVLWLITVSMEWSVD